MDQEAGAAQPEFSAPPSTAQRTACFAKLSTQPDQVAVSFAAPKEGRYELGAGLFFLCAKLSTTLPSSLSASVGSSSPASISF
jgi:hypothetical protein